MRKSALPPVIAFAATVGVIVPAGWHTLEAELEVDGPRTRPARKTLMVDGADIQVDLDRGVLKTGGTVTVTLVATAASPREVELDVRMLATQQGSGHRVAAPGVLQDTRHITVMAKPGGETTTVAFTTARTPMRAGAFNLFDVEIAPAVEAFRTTPAGDPNVVRMGVVGWNDGGLPVKMTPTTTIPAEGEFAIDVAVQNTSNRPLDHVVVDFGAPRYSELAMEFTPDRDFRVALSGDVAESPLAAGATRVFTFRVLPTRPGITRFPLLATVRALQLPTTTMSRDDVRRLLATNATFGTIETTVFERPARTAKK
ncbi:MAG: hypothetical protein ABI867_31175 [Kofleriaceae bacterium]